MSIDDDIHARVATMADLLREVAADVLHKACHWQACIDDDPSNPNWHAKCQEHRDWYRRYEAVMD